jgi:hypothetical protein
MKAATHKVISNELQKNLIWKFSAACVSNRQPLKMVEKLVGVQ